ncbi:MAG: NPCBM/NEW2 domain-containing protein [Armatimonadota bacterium]
MCHSVCYITVFSLILSSAITSASTVPTKREMLLRDAWINCHFMPLRRSSEKISLTSVIRPGLLVTANHGGILFNARPDGRLLKIGDKEFNRGLICHAVSKVIVQLPGNGARFSSIIGVDANAGGGTVIFSVKCGGKEVFRSRVMQGSEPGIPVDIDLKGARSFTISAEDAGDGIACDHADWADAKVTLGDGSEIWLSDMKVIEPELPERVMASPPFSFIYDDRLSDQLLGSWKFNESTNKTNDHRTIRVQSYTDPATGLEVRCEAVIYSDFPTIEWTVYLKNTGDKDTPIIKDIQALDSIFNRSASGEFLLHHFIGSRCEEQDFRPVEAVLEPNSRKRITGANGRPTSEDLCYFNIENTGGRGINLGVGWPGQWAASFDRDSDAGLRVTTGQELINLKLHPGEEIRTPLVVLQFWENGDWIRSQNIWRKWMIEYNMPDHNGRPIQPQYDGCGGNPLPYAEEEITLLDGYIKDGLKPNPWIIDAGWYVNRGDWTDTGTWEVDKKRFPNGLKEVADFLHKNGLEFVVWFEPERVNGGTWLSENHPEWVLGGKNGGLLNLGNPEARKWITDRIDKMLTEEGIDHYRSDYNIDPLSYWIANDTEDRMGMTENAYVQGFLAFWDELLRRHPGMYIDTCASGGRRNDLETLRRSVPLLRSDWAVLAFSPDGAAGQQGQTHSLSLWLPFHGTGVPSSDLYTLRSSYAPAFRFGYDSRDPNRNKDLALRAVSEFMQIEPYMLADYYPLTPYSLEKDKWIAWQYNSPEKGGGAVQVFRREESPEDSMTVYLRDLEPDTEYTVSCLDDGNNQHINGAVLMTEGMRVTIPEKRGSAVFAYKKK